jgi:hypothetical protein
MKVRQSAAPRHFRAHSRKQSVSILDTNLAAEISVIIESDAVQDADIPGIMAQTHQAMKSIAYTRRQLRYIVKIAMAIFLDGCRGATFSYVHGSADPVAGRSLRFVRRRSPQDALRDAMGRY